MSSRLKKISLIIGGIIVMLVIGIIIWLFIQKPIPSPVPPTEPTVPIPPTAGLPSTGGRVSVTPGVVTPSPVVTGLPQAAPSDTAKGGATKITALSVEEAFKPIVNSTGAVRYYAPQQGSFFQATPHQAPQKLTSTLFPVAQDIVWSKQGDQAIVVFPDDSKVLYNFTNKKQTTLPAFWHDFSFSPDGSELVFKIDNANPDKRWLIAAAPDGSHVRAIEPLGENGNKVIPLWSPTNEVAAVYAKASQYSQQEVYFLGFNQENYRTMLVDGYDFRPQWSPKGDRLLYSVYASDGEMKPGLWIADARGEAIGQNRRNLTVATWADKCAFSSDNISIFCAVPRALPLGAGAYPELAKDVPDDFYKIDTQTGIRTFLAYPAGQDVNAKNITLSTDESQLVFQDGITGRAYQIKLK